MHGFNCFLLGNSVTFLSVYCYSVNDKNVSSVAVSPLLFLPKDLSFGASGRSVPSEESDCCSFLFLTVASRHLWARTADYRMERQSQSVSPPISTIFFAVVRKTARKSSHPVYEIVIYHVMFLACKKDFFLNLLFCFFSCALFSPSCFALYLWLPGF